ncbi:hypothetical protein AB6A40_005916 [Gnathostoma spinigerum]|uniref:Uncharacterized protein n=1 Tax=Gnathostoma spinigerum TaxID=75299 RepID=A0ABD6ERM6_9BILA
MSATQLGLLFVALLAVTTCSGVHQTCTQIMASPEDDNHNKVLLCQLYESSALLAQLGALVNEGIDRLMAEQGDQNSCFLLCCTSLGD